jgi:Alginate lyase
MTRCWMFGSLLFGSFIAIGRNIRMTFEQGSLLDSYVFFHTVPVNEKNAVRRILSDDESSEDSQRSRYSFIYFDENALAKERHLYRSGTPEISSAMETLLKQTSEIMRSYKHEDNDKPANGKNKKRKVVTFLPHLIDASKVLELQQQASILGLAYFLTGSDEYAEQAVAIVRSGFLDPRTHMAPKALVPSPVARAHIYQLLDAIQMVHSYFVDEDIPQLQEWFTHYVKLLEQTRKELVHSNNYTALYFDIEDMAVSHFVGDEARQAQIWKRATERLAHQIAEDDTMPQALREANCENAQMYTLQGWWTLSRLFANAMGESLWTAEREALCRASIRAIPYFHDHPKCNADEVVDDKRWWPLVVDTIRNCPNSRTLPITWREWMTPESKDLPPDLYAFPISYPFETGIPPFWNFGIPVKSITSPVHADKSLIGKGENDNIPGLHIPAKLAKAAEQDKEMEQRVIRIKKWHALGQVDVAERMMRKALRDLRSRKILWSPKDFIPTAMLEAAKTDEALAERVNRIRRWHALGQTGIVDRMIKKSMDELALEAEDDAAVEELKKQTVEASMQKDTFLRTQRHNIEATTVSTKASEDKSDTTNEEPQSKSSLVQKLLESSTTESHFVSPPTEAEMAQVLVDAVKKSSAIDKGKLQIPESLIQQSQNDPELAKRIHRIRRWQKLGQFEVAGKMIQKLLASTEDQLF